MISQKGLPRSFYNRPAKIVARDLLGKILFHRTEKGIISGYIVETESYGGKDDPASHAYKKITPRNSVMFGPSGHAYVYLCYGFYNLFNVVTEKEGIPSAVLLRAIEPITGMDIMKKNRKINNIFGLTNGPGKFTQAFMIDKKFNKKPVYKGKLLILDSDYQDFKIIKKKRIGIKLGAPSAEKLLRFYIKDNQFVSQK